MTPSRSATPAWVWVGIGCLTTVALLAMVVGGLVYYGFRKTRQVEATMKDPVARVELARELLAAESLPEGYHVASAFSVPLLMETVVLSDRALETTGGDDLFGERGFVYVKTLAFGDQARELEDLFEGRTDRAEILDRNSIGLRDRELLARGSLDEGDRTVRWVVYRGDVGRRQISTADRALSALALIDCPDDERLRMGIWFAPDPDPETAAADVDLSGTIGDPGEIQRFMAGFDLCSR